MKYVVASYPNPTFYPVMGLVVFSSPISGMQAARVTLKKEKERKHRRKVFASFFPRKTRVKAAMCWQVDLRGGIKKELLPARSDELADPPLVRALRGTRTTLVVLSRLSFCRRVTKGEERLRARQGCIVADCPNANVQGASDNGSARARARYCIREETMSYVHNVFDATATRLDTNGRARVTLSLSLHYIRIIAALIFLSDAQRRI